MGMTTLHIPHGPTLRAHSITIPNRLGKCLPRPAAGSLDIVPWARELCDAGIPLDHRQARNRHVAAQPDQITFALKVVA
jgi:hypothetical protein